jgi:hypothetical protein
MFKAFDIYISKCEFLLVSSSEYYGDVGKNGGRDKITRAKCNIFGPIYIDEVNLAIYL